MRGAARAIAREVAGAKRVLVLSHIRPDGDAVGSSLALASILRAAGHRADVVLNDEVPRRLRFLPGAKQVRAAGGAKVLGGRLVFALDTTSPDRLGAASAILESASRTINIDHHVSNSLFGDVNWVEPKAGAVGEMIWRLAAALRWKIPPAARDPLFVAIMTDTGRFTFPNTTPESFEIASALVSAGASPGRLAETVYGGKSSGEWELEGRARGSLVVERGGRIATIALTARDFRETGTTPAATQGFASLPRLLDGVDVGLFFYEIDGGARTKVGFRTSHALDADRLAARFGGGGHPQAAGCTLDGNLGKVRRRVLAETRRFMGEGPRRRRKGAR